ncbi:MAG: YceD family protein [Thermodesulfobacteriota bacterium]
MKVRLSDIGDDGLHIVTLRKPEWLSNIPELARDTDDMHLSSNILFDLRLSKILKEINVCGTIRFSIRSLCARCLRNADLSIVPGVNLVLSPASTLQEGDENIDFETYKGEEFDLGNYLREIIAMSLPVKVLCEEDCKGLCSNCGANLNLQICSCKGDWVDPRFTVLRGFKNLIG